MNGQVSLRIASAIARWRGNQINHEFEQAERENKMRLDSCGILACLLDS
jgi:hypothetical protein